MMEVDFLLHLTVLGGNYVGLAFARLYQRFGSESGARSQGVGTHLLSAVGRRPNTDDFGLDKAGIVTDKLWVDKDNRSLVALSQLTKRAGRNGSWFSGQWSLHP
jgi:pyruvate/2-oxoglutarate dehydrogenase complex dihydrolipoamide dehydrogenase (E3) component